jgi:DNA-binding MarR family transcriptional regulator
MTNNLDPIDQSALKRENWGLLSILEALEPRAQISQRELARLTGLNLRKVNYSLHKLLERGYVKFQRVRQHPDKRAYLYILTPAGLKAKSKLTYDFLKFTFDFYNKMEEKLCRCLAEMAGAGLEHVVLYGASDAARILIELAKKEGSEIVGVVDDDCEGHDFYGVPLLERDGLHQATWDCILITKLEEIEVAESQLHQLGVPEQSIWTLS